VSPLVAPYARRAVIASVAGEKCPATPALASVNRRLHWKSKTQSHAPNAQAYTSEPVNAGEHARRAVRARPLGSEPQPPEPLGASRCRRAPERSKSGEAGRGPESAPKLDRCPTLVVRKRHPYRRLTRSAYQGGNARGGRRRLHPLLAAHWRGGPARLLAHARGVWRTRKDATRREFLTTKGFLGLIYPRSPVAIQGPRRSAILRLVLTVISA